MSAETIILADKLGKALTLLEGAAPYEEVPVDLRKGDINLLLKALGLLAAVREATQ